MLNNWRKAWVFWLLAGALALVQTGCSSVHADRQEVPELLEPVRKQEDLYEVKRGTIEKKLSGPGIFIPASTKFYSYTTNGRVEQIFVKPGDTVKEGDLLIQLYTSDLETKIADQRLVVAEAEDNLKNKLATQDPEQIRLAKLNQDVEQMKLEALEQNLRDRSLVADRSGVVTFVDLIQPGSNITAYRDLVGISDPKEMLFMYTSQRNSNELYAINRDMAATVEFNGKVYTGKVIQSPRNAPASNNIIESDKGNKSLLIQLDQNPPDAVFGSQGELSIVTDRAENVLIIPRVGLRSYQGRSYVRILDGDVRREVDVVKGIETATEVEIRRGLEEGQKIILNN